MKATKITKAENRGISCDKKLNKKNLPPVTRSLIRNNTFIVSHLIIFEKNEFT